ncbi:MAG: DUF1206 domain-containing protein [Pseudonocardia sp.]|nr:DUF1206 domain-containing protein [Pseudonocardia sp.]
MGLAEHVAGQGAGRQANHEVDEPAPEDPPVRLGARAGLVVNGIMYLLVAWLAVRVALGDQDRADQAGALQTLAREPGGRVLVLLVGAGFAAVALWRAREAVWGSSPISRPSLRWRQRLYSGSQVVGYAALAMLAFRVAWGSGAGNGGQGVAAWLLTLRIGPPLLVVVGISVAVAAAVMAFRGWRMDFASDLDLDRASPAVRAVAERCGQFGSVARGIAFGVIGVLVAVAGLRYQPAKAEGLDAALKTLAGQPYGPLLLGIVALGLASYGVFSFFDARYHRF